MNQTLEQLVTEVIAATGADAPDLLAEDSPALAETQNRDAYFIGLIGGKDVGKSSLVNALVGIPISAVTSSGPGTQIVIAYAHVSAAQAVEQTLAGAVPGKFRIITHENPALARQVLLDLPDIDSIHSDHIQITRRMLRHILYPVWLQSVEKYADERPRMLLARVAEGNDASNFLFVLNKVDLVAQREGQDAVGQLAEDYAQRLARSLALPQPPTVYAISAANPALFDLPAFRARLSQQRSPEQVSQSRELAWRRRSRTLLEWLGRQQLQSQAERADRLARDATEIAYERVAAPVLEAITTRLADDADFRAELIEPATSRRLARWPIVGAINAVLAPIVGAVRAGGSGPSGSAPDLILNCPDAAPIAQRTATTFAHIARLNSAVAPLYQHRKLWEEPAALSAAAELRARLANAAHRQRQAMLERAGGRPGFIAPVVRILLTIGAAIWFPFLQPIAQVLVADGWKHAAGELARLVVGILSAAHLFQSLGFLLLWYLLLWVLLRWHTHRRGIALIRSWQTDPTVEPQLSFAAQTVQWLDDLLAPLRARQATLLDLARRERELRDREPAADRRAA